MIDRVILVGFMAAGKTSVGRRLAERLGWRFVDLDEWIEQRAGSSVRDIFAERGEAAFRELEVEATRELAALRRLVLAPGGGWIMQPGLLAAVRPGSRTVWLRVSAAEAVRRATSAGGERPLLAGGDPLASAKRLLAEREPSYRAAELQVDTEGRGIEDITEEILARLGGDEA